MITVQETTIRARSIVSAASRYRDQKVLYYGDQNLLTFDTYKRSNYVKTGTEKVMVITKGVEYRPDLVSYDVYGFSDVWWRILEANNIMDIFEFKTGRTIILPEDVV